MSNDEEKKEFPLLDTGAYRCSLKIKEADIATWDDVNKRYNPDKTKPGFRLVFKTEEGPDAFITRDVAKSNHEKSNVMKITRQLYDSSLSMIKFNDKDFVENAEDLYKLWFGLQDYEFMVKVEQRTSKKGNKYHAYVDAAPINVPRPEQVVENKQMEFDDDSIPF